MASKVGSLMPGARISAREGMLAAESPVYRTTSAWLSVPAVFGSVRSPSSPVLFLSGSSSSSSSVFSLSESLALRVPKAAMAAS
ncbi:hypothetical protein D3C86_1995660 [compost metagenome]